MDFKYIKDAEFVCESNKISVSKIDKVAKKYTIALIFISLR